ncbi:GvpL/GvpF family gas vesicle protein, partial [Salmonella enterica]|uniref:GvpL/GvpF family gas vesicle protein n=1 Tax=Salmonella enterica TaxID=28901 RepID=UPI001562281B
MTAHERVLEDVMGQFPLLPVRFGTLADSSRPTEDTRRLLDARHQEFHRLLMDMADKVELGLKAFWKDEKAVFQEILADNGELRRLRDSLLGQSPEATRLERMHLGEMVKAALGRKRVEEAARILLPPAS